MTDDLHKRAEDAVTRYEQTNAMKELRGPLSKRATSGEFNEWMARDVVEYVDALLARLEAVEADLTAAYRAGVEDALDRIDDFNTLPPDESGHRWRESDLLDQEVMSIRALPTPTAADLAEILKEKTDD